MTDRQRDTLRRLAYRQQIYLAVLAGMLAIFMLGILLLEFRAHRRLYVSPPVLAFMLALIGLGALAAALLWSRRREFRDDLQNGIVKTAVGQVKLMVIVRVVHADYRVHVASHTFPVSKQAVLALREGARYRVYFAPISRTLLAAEPMPDS